MTLREIIFALWRRWKDEGGLVGRPRGAERGAGAMPPLTTLRTALASAIARRLLLGPGLHRVQPPRSGGRRFAGPHVLGLVATGTLWRASGGGRR